jgi:hypothetical protein
MTPRAGILRLVGASVMACAAVSPCIAGSAPTPSIDAIQAAYETAKADAKERHDDKLLIREAECQDAQQGQISCQIGFTDERSSNGRLYFDVVGLDRVAAGWKLVSGLCQR